MVGLLSSPANVGFGKASLQSFLPKIKEKLTNSESLNNWDNTKQYQGKDVSRLLVLDNWSLRCKAKRM